MVALGKRRFSMRQKAGLNSTSTKRSCATPRRTSASVTGPVPGPSSMIGPGTRGST
jgi:hypothetical protein